MLFSTAVSREISELYFQGYIAFGLLTVLGEKLPLAAQFFFHLFFVLFCRLFFRLCGSHCIPRDSHSVSLTVYVASLAAVSYQRPLDPHLMCRGV